MSGLAGGGLVLQNNGGNDLPIAASGNFAFSTALAEGTAFNVTVKTQPLSPSQTCVVTSGTGAIGSANVANVAVTCTTNTYSIGGTVAGLTGSGLVLQDNAGNDLRVAAGGGTFSFSTPIASGATYQVTVKTQGQVGKRAATTAVALAFVRVEHHHPHRAADLEVDERLARLPVAAGVEPAAQHGLTGPGVEDGLGGRVVGAVEAQYLRRRHQVLRAPRWTAVSSSRARLNGVAFSYSSCRFHQT